MKFDFTYKNLENFVLFLKQNCNVVQMKDYKKRKKNIILRFDVDFDVESILKIQAMLKRNNVTASFYFLTTSPYYNVCSSNVKKILKDTSKGFEVGLHFDPMVYDTVDSKTLEGFVDKESEILSSIINKPIESVSLHNLCLFKEGIVLFPKYVNAYDSYVFNDERYLSDSMFPHPYVDSFRGKNPYDFVKKCEKFPLQILLHPEHYSYDNGGYHSSINRYIAGVGNSLFGMYINDLDKIWRDKLYRIK